MSLDIKYRPKRFEDVLGQDATITILRRFVATSRGRHQSYLIAGPYGSGKTTVGRILARALLCSQPTAEGDPCDQCSSCRSILDLGSSMDFTEVDAATNSGKAEIQKITEEIQYDSFTGRQRLYLFDEAHQLSASALDAMLKPLEEHQQGTQDKKLVCIFCTTEPEKMRATIFSRCAPAFVIHPVAPAEIAERMAFICGEESIEYEKEMLVTLAEMTECHIRDSLKAIEGISMLGPINKENVVAYLHLDLTLAYLDVLQSIGQDPAVAVTAVKKILEKTSPVVCYERLANLAILAYQIHLGVMNPPAHIDADRIRAVGQQHGEGLLRIAHQFASRPRKPNPAMLLCDIGVLHYGDGIPVPATSVVVRPVVPQEAPVNPPPQKVGGTPAPATKTVPDPPQSGRMPKTGEPTVLRGAKNIDDPNQSARTTPSTGCDGLFATILRQAIVDARARNEGPSR